MVRTRPERRDCRGDHSDRVDPDAGPRVRRSRPHCAWRPGAWDLLRRPDPASVGSSRFRTSPRQPACGPSNRACRRRNRRKPRARRTVGRRLPARLRGHAGNAAVCSSSGTWLRYRDVHNGQPELDRPTLFRVVDRYLARIHVDGRPATFATAGEAAWREAVRRRVAASGSCPVHDARFAVRLDLRLGTNEQPAKCGTSTPDQADARRDGRRFRLPEMARTTAISGRTESRLP